MARLSCLVVVTARSGAGVRQSSDELDKLAGGSASLEHLLNAWNVVVDHVVDTESAMLAFGERDHQPVVLRVSRNHGDEWQSGDVLTAFQGKGIVRLLDHVDGAVLLERLSPGESLATMAINGDDDRATRVLAGIIGRISPGLPPHAVPSVEDWSQAFERYEATGDRQIPQETP